MRSRLVLRAVAALWLAVSAGFAWAEVPPAITLANVYVPGGDPAGYYISEKLDGVRGYWDGRQLLTRGGTVIHAPAWFTKGWPAHPVDGELWAGHGRFEQAVSTVRDEKPDDAAWRNIRYMLFDLPGHAGPFHERVVALAEAVKAINQPWVQMIPQTPATTAKALQQQLREVIRHGGEGLILHRTQALYQAGRSDDLLKVKPYLDAEARVIAHVAGKGKYVGQLGALLVETETGQRFKLGSGFSDAERRAPPAIGSWVTYRYRDVTSKGVPRFATYLRIRVDKALSQAATTE